MPSTPPALPFVRVAGCVTRARPVAADDADDGATNANADGVVAVAATDVDDGNCADEGNGGGDEDRDDDEDDDDDGSVDDSDENVFTTPDVG